MLNGNGLGSEFFNSVGIKQINIPCLRGYITMSSSPQMNHVGLAELDGTSVDKVIQETIDLFRIEKKSFTWAVGPNSRPHDINSHLEKFGFELRNDISEYGMVLSTSDEIYNSENSSSIDVSEVSLDDLENRAEVISESFGQGMTPETAIMVVNMAKLLNSTERYRNKIKGYLATDTETGKTVGYSMMEMDTEDRHAILDGSAVLQAYRRRWIYRKMIWMRQRDARDNGVDHLIIHAVKNTSAPVCEKVWFRKMCGINFYSYIVEP
jgi:hypothetical protein